ncbi:MAG: peptidase M15 [Prevotella sp.]|nr:peptidase M15 [Prevotella sp.]
MQLSENFTLEELTASTTAKARKIDNTPSREEIENLSVLCRRVLQPLRDKYGSSIIVTSGYRSEALNKAVGGVKTSQHRYGEAADIKCSDIKKLWNIAVEMVNKNEIIVGQLIDEKNLSWIHISLPTKTKKNQILHLK